MLLKTSLEDQKLHIQLLSQTAQQLRVFGQLVTLTPPTIRSSDTGFSSHHTLNSEDDTSSQAGAPELHDGSSLQTADGSSSACCSLHNLSQQCTGSLAPPINIRDPKLVDFLTELHLDRISIEKV